MFVCLFKDMLFFVVYIPTGFMLTIYLQRPIYFYYKRLQNNEPRNLKFAAVEAAITYILTTVKNNCFNLECFVLVSSVFRIFNSLTYTWDGVYYLIGPNYTYDFVDSVIMLLAGRKSLYFNENIYYKAFLIF